MALVLGVDPGKTGAAVAITEAGLFVSACPASWDRGSLSSDVFEWIDGLGLIEAAAIEDVLSYAGTDNPAATKSAVAVAVSAGCWIGMLGTLSVRNVLRVRPQTWQAKVLGRFPRGFKGASKAAAMRWARMVHGAAIEPHLAIGGDGIADAAGIAEWRRLQLAEERQRDRAVLAEARRGRC